MTRFCNIDDFLRIKYLSFIIRIHRLDIVRTQSPFWKLVQCGPNRHGMWDAGIKKLPKRNQEKFSTESWLQNPKVYFPLLSESVCPGATMWSSRHSRANSWILVNWCTTPLQYVVTRIKCYIPEYVNVFVELLLRFDGDNGNFMIIAHFSHFPSSCATSRLLRWLEAGVACCKPLCNEANGDCWWLHDAYLQPFMTMFGSS